MARILMHSPMNISRALGEMLKEFCGTMAEKHGLQIEVETQPHRPVEKSLFEYYLEKNDLPDVVVGHANDFADISDEFLSRHFLSLPDRFPLRKELDESGFTDPRGYFHTFAVIPFSILYNRNMVTDTQLPCLWKDLLDEKWHRSILMPDEYRLVSIIVRTFMKSRYQESFEIFQNNVLHQGSPVDVVNAVDAGQYPLGITNIAWARIARQKNTGLIWPRDGAFCIPQIMVWKKDVDERLLEIGEFLMSSKVQQFIAAQSFVPASAWAALPALVEDNSCNLIWESWEHFLKVIKGSLA